MRIFAYYLINNAGIQTTGSSLLFRVGLDPSDTEKLMQGLGSGMATALLTTFYGVLSSNFIFSPIATKIEKRIEDQILMMRVCMEGIILVLKKTPENMVRDQLKVYLPVQWASISSNNAQQMTEP